MMVLVAWEILEQINLFCSELHLQLKSAIWAQNHSYLVLDSSSAFNLVGKNPKMSH